MHTNRTDRIKRGSIATLVALTLTTGASPVMAAEDAETDTTVVERPSREAREAARAERAAQRDALRQWVAARKEIQRTRTDAVRAAREVMVAAVRGATDRTQVRAARDAFKAAIAEAKAAHDAAVEALGPRPTFTK